MNNLSTVLDCVMRWPRVGRRWCLLLWLAVAVVSSIIYIYHTIDYILLEEKQLRETTAKGPINIADSKVDIEDMHGDMCFSSKSDLVDFPNCPEKWQWMKEQCQAHTCFAKNGVFVPGCSIRKYLSVRERHCPSAKGMDQQPNYAKPNFSMDDLFSRMSDNPVNFEFIKHRIERMWESWKEAYRINLKQHNKTMRNQRTQKIILHLGFLTKTKFGELSSKGGPLGELVQWSDLIAALHILGHELRISTQTNTLAQTMLKLNNATACADAGQVDLIFTDIMGLRLMSRKMSRVTNACKCKLRILDSFGTQAQFNSKAYFTAHKADLGKKNPWGGFGLALRQFFSLYPHSPDNTFLGFVVNTHATASETELRRERSGVLVYGKEKYMWESAGEAVRAAMQVTEVHATVADAADATSLPPGVINHGLLGEEQFHALLSKVRVFLGLGFPFEGPAPLEAVAHGAVFINPRFYPAKGRMTDAFFHEKPTLRALSSQCPYLEEMGEPWVLTLNISDTAALKEAIQKAMRTEVNPRLPAELTAAGMLLRVAVVVDRLDTCSPQASWPPPSSLQTRVGKPGESCSAACATAGLRCDSALFPLINSTQLLQESGCESVAKAPSIVAPSKCTLQEDALLYSCASSLRSIVRVCPCRDFLPDQRELCTRCL